MSIRRIVGGAFVGAVLLASCSGGDAAPTEQESLAVGRLVDADLSIDEQRCILDGLQELEIGPERILDGDLSAEEDGEVLAVSVECVEDLASIDAFVDSFIEGAAEAGTTLTVDEARCAIRALDATDTDAAILGCLANADGPVAEGDDPILDLLVEQCRRGNNQACDELFTDSPAGSEYSIYGQTCGNRLPEGEGLTCFDTLG